MYMYIYTYNQWLLLSTDIPGGAAEVSGRSSADPRSWDSDARLSGANVLVCAALEHVIHGEVPLVKLVQWEEIAGLVNIQKAIENGHL